MSVAVFGLHLAPGFGLGLQLHRIEKNCQSYLRSPSRIIDCCEYFGLLIESVDDARSLALIRSCWLAGCSVLHLFAKGSEIQKFEL